VWFRSFVSHVDIPTSAIVSARCWHAESALLYAPSAVGGPQFVSSQWTAVFAFSRDCCERCLVGGAAITANGYCGCRIFPLFCAATLHRDRHRGRYHRNILVWLPSRRRIFALASSSFISTATARVGRLDTCVLVSFRWAWSLCVCSGRSVLFCQLGWKFIVAPLLVLAGAHVSAGNRMSWACTAGRRSLFPALALHYPIFCWVNGFYRMLFGTEMRD